MRTTSTDQMHCTQWCSLHTRTVIQSCSYTPSSERMPNYASNFQPPNYANNYAGIIRRCLQTARISWWRTQISKTLSHRWLLLWMVFREFASHASIADRVASRVASQKSFCESRFKRDSQKLLTRSAMDACDANSRNTIHRRSQLCDKVLQIWLRHHDIRAVWYNLYKFIGNSWTFVQLCCRKGQNRTPNRLSHRKSWAKLNFCDGLRWPSCVSCVGSAMVAIWGFPGFAAVASRVASQKSFCESRFKLFCDAKCDATRSATDACDANSRNTIHRRSQWCDNILLIWLRHHDIRAVWYNLYK